MTPLIGCAEIAISAVRDVLLSNLKYTPKTRLVFMTQTETRRRSWEINFGGTRGRFDHSYRNRCSGFSFYIPQTHLASSISGISRYLLMTDSSVGDCERDINLGIVIITYNDVDVYFERSRSRYRIADYRFRGKVVIGFRRDCYGLERAWW